MPQLLGLRPRWKWSLEPIPQGNISVSYLDGKNCLMDVGKSWLSRVLTQVRLFCVVGARRGQNGWVEVGEKYVVKGRVLQVASALASLKHSRRTGS